MFKFQKKFFTLLIVDPDAPPQIDGEFYLHMVKSNIPVSITSTPLSFIIVHDYRV